MSTVLPKTKTLNNLVTPTSLGTDLLKFKDVKIPAGFFPAGYEFAECLTLENLADIIMQQLIYEKWLEQPDPSTGGGGGVDAIPPNEMHFTTLAGSVDYVGTQGDQILLSDNSIVDITTTDATVTFNAPAGKHVVKLVESVGRNNYVSIGGGALVELHNFPKLSTVTKFNFSTYSYNPAPNLTKVPSVLPSNITDISSMFRGASAFNQDINGWNVSNVTNMNSMFREASAFNQPLNNWNVSNVTNMGYMFRGASAFNQPLNNWNVSNVTDMTFMFRAASSFNQNIGMWNVSNVTNMMYMFGGASAFNQPLNNWNVSNVTNMTYMLGDTNFNQDISGWNVFNVTNMNSMFEGASAFNQNIGMWNVSNVTTMNNMFQSASAFNQDLSKWCVSKIASAPSGFDLNASSWTLPRPVWGTCPTP